MSGAGGLSSITEFLANLDWKTVIVVIAVLIGIRFILVRQGSQAAKSAAEIAESLAIAMGLVFLIIRPFFVQAFFIPSESMVPTLMVSDHILVNKTVYRVRDPKFGDVVVFDAPPEALALRSPAENVSTAQTQYIKRCIGVPGDEIYVTPGYVSARGMMWNHENLREIFRASVKILDNGILVDGKPLDNKELADSLQAKGSVEFHPGKVFKNGKALNEPYTNEDPDFAYPRLIPDTRDQQGPAMVEN
jgi:signal peptidase I